MEITVDARDPRIDLKEIIERADQAGLDAVQTALTRETVIRKVMRDSGEPRDIVVEMIDAMQSMASEAVLDLMEGEPTTLRAALQRYVESLPEPDGTAADWDVADDLSAILAYPWPEEEAVLALHEPNTSLKLTVSYPDDETVTVCIGSNLHEICHGTYDDLGSSGMSAMVNTAQAVHRAVLARVIADRDHHVQLSSTDRRSMLQWLERPSGAWTTDNPSRVTLNAVEGGGVLVRTRPYAHVDNPKSRA
jgi:hypothetical protein